MSAGGQQGHVQSCRRINQCFAMLDILGWKLGKRSRTSLRISCERVGPKSEQAVNGEQLTSLN